MYFVDNMRAVIKVTAQICNNFNNLFYLIVDINELCKEM